MWRVQILASGSAGNAAVISDGETSVLIDAGVSAAKIPMMKDVSAILLSHGHIDHTRYAIMAERYEKPIYGLKETLASYWVEDVPDRLKTPVQAGRAYSIGSLRVIPFMLSHDVPCCGYYVLNAYKESLAWIADTSEIEAEITADVYCVECNYDEEMLDERGQNGDMPINLYGRLISESGHMGARHAAEYVKKYAPPQAAIILHHLSKNNMDKSKIETIFGRQVMIEPKEFSYGLSCPY